MEINANQTVGEIVNIVKDLIGSKLSTVKGQNNTSLPAVRHKRSEGTMPDFPYILVDHVGFNQVGYSSRAQYFNDDNNQVTEFDVLGRFIVEVYGSVKDDVNSLAVELRQRLFTTQGSNSIDAHLTQGLLNSTSDVSFFPSRLETDFQELSRFTIDLNMVSQIVDVNEDSTYIETNVVESNLYEDFNQDNPPITQNITSP